jgi:hypothetical protein
MVGIGGRLPFNRLLRMISAIPDTSLTPPYSIPSPVISVVTIAVTKVLVHTSTYGSLLSAFRLSNLPLPPPTSFKTSNACMTAVMAKVRAQIFRTILGALVGAFSGYFR